MFDTHVYNYIYDVCAGPLQTSPLPTVPLRMIDFTILSLQWELAVVVKLAAINLNIMYLISLSHSITIEISDGVLLATLLLSSSVI